ncbi:MAG: TRAM domain-containing protein [Victivallaceae bacterium]
MEKGDLFQTEISDIAFGGSGIGRLRGKVCFIPYTAPGEKVFARVIKEKSDFIQAKVVDIIKPSPHRTTPACRYYKLCQGCSYQHLEYAFENQIKEQQFKDFITRAIPVADGVLDQPSIPDKQYGYRNKITLHAQHDRGNMALGYVMEDNTTVLDIRECPLANEEINEELNQLKNDPSFSHTLKDNMTVTFRHTDYNGVVYWRNKSPAKMSWLKEQLPCGLFAVPAGSFFQINRQGCCMLLECVRDTMLKEAPPLVIDLYCGSGLFGVAATNVKVPTIVGIEEDPYATAAAKYNLTSHGCADFAILTGDAGKALKNILPKIIPGTVMIVDPPRTGLSSAVTRMIARSNLKKLIYISCGPDTLSRDLKQFHAAGFNLSYAKMINMFPRTAHFEIFTLLKRD